MPRRKPRKERSDNQGLSRVLSIKISDEIHAQWAAAAEQQGLSVGAWLREAAELAIARGSTR
jgi:predicted HicB family RNase H-like nuclease